jgi:DnaK suppressor protein
MDATKLDGMRESLIARRAEIQAEVDRMATEMRWLGGDQEDEAGSLGNHLADDGSDVMEQERLSTISADLQDMLRQIDGALERMDDGSYGICQRCGQPINPERLEAFPYVAYCIDCQTLLERENALRPRF